MSQILESIDWKPYALPVRICTGFDPDYIDLEIKTYDDEKSWNLLTCHITILDILVFKQTYVHTEVPSRSEIWNPHICSDDIGNAHFHQGSLHGISHHPQRNHRKNFVHKAFSLDNKSFRRNIDPILGMVDTFPLHHVQRILEIRQKWWRCLQYSQILLILKRFTLLYSFN